MSILDLFKSKNIDESVPSVPIDSNEDGETIYSDDLVSTIKAELERRRSDRAVYELQWTLNANFLAGNQNCDIDYQSMNILDEGVINNTMERRVYNRIAPLMETRAANLKTVDYNMVVNPRSNDADDQNKAKISTKLLKFCQSSTGFNEQKTKIISWAELTGTVFTVSWWDKNKGEKVANVVQEGITPDGTPYSVESDLKSGDVSFALLSSYEVFPHTLEIEEISNQHDIITEQVLDVDKIYEIYGVRVNGKETQAYVLTPLPTGVGGHGRNATVFGINKTARKDCEKVITYYENPTKRFPRGRVVIIVGDQIVHYGELPGGINPLVAIKSKTSSGLFFGRSVIQDLIPLQRSYNEIQNKIVDYIYTVANAPWLSPSGSIDIDAIQQDGGVASGSILEYDPNFGKPEIVQYPSPPPVMESQLAKISSDMEYTAGVSQLMVYGVASNQTSGAALNTRREIDMTRMSLTGDCLRNGVVAMAKVWLNLNKQYSVGERVIQISGKDDFAAVFTWCAEDINSFDVEYSAENELAHSKEQQRQDFLAMFDRGVFNSDDGRMSRMFKRKAWEMFKIGNLDEIDDIDDIQRKAAQKENVLLDTGVIPKRYRYDDDEIHLDEHVKFALSTEYRRFKEKNPEYCSLFEQHIDEHKQKVDERQMAMQQMAMQQQQLKYGGK